MAYNWSDTSLINAGFPLPLYYHDESWKTLPNNDKELAAMCGEHGEREDESASATTATIQSNAALQLNSGVVSYCVYRG